MSSSWILLPFILVFSKLIVSLRGFLLMPMNLNLLGFQVFSVVKDPIIINSEMVFETTSLTLAPEGYTFSSWIKMDSFSTWKSTDNCRTLFKIYSDTK